MATPWWWMGDMLFMANAPDQEAHEFKTTDNHEIQQARCYQCGEEGALTMQQPLQGQIEVREHTRGVKDPESWKGKADQ